MPKIPPDRMDAVRTLFTLGEDQASRLRDVILSTRPRTYLSDFAEAVGKRTPEVNAAEGIIEALANIHRNTAKGEALSETLQDLGKQVDLPPGESTKNQAMIQELVRDRSPLAISAKAQKLALSQDRTYCEANVLTDLRPIFGPEISAGPVAAVLFHNLVVKFHGSGPEVDQVRFALQRDDLESLRAAIDRAIAKDDIIRSEERNRVVD